MPKLLAVVILLAAAAHAEDFSIRDGDTVVFLGDSITAEGTCGKIIENYTLLRFPNRKVHFINQGHGGETAEGALKRLDSAVFERGATLVTVAYGINDIGWGAKADDEHRRKYLDSIREIVNRCKEKNVRVLICSAAITGADPDKSENDYLQKMCDEGMAISKSLGEGAVDVQRGMRDIAKRIKEFNANEEDPKKHVTLHAADTIHLNDLGQHAMAFVLLNGMNAPAEISSAEITGDKVKSSGCEISNLKSSEGSVEFDRLDEGLPLNFGLFGALKFRFIPIPEKLNRYMLTVKNLKPGRYDIVVDSRGVGTFSADDLSRGINISSATADGWEPGGPWEAQAWLLNMLTNSRTEMLRTDKYADELIKSNPNREGIRKQTRAINEQMESLQRETARPHKYHFVIKPSAAPAPSPDKPARG